MKIKLINPNTTLSMTHNIQIAAERYALRDTEIYSVSPLTGPESIESFYDEYYCIPGVLTEIIKGDREEGADAFVIACFGDPGIRAAREVTQKPVVGICQAAVVTARAVAPCFSVVSILERSSCVVEEALRFNGALDICRSVRATGLGVLDFEQNFQHGLEMLELQSKLAIEEDGAEAILLGCAGLVGFVDQLREKLGVPVFDGVSPAVKLAEMLVALGCTTSKINTWSQPQKKRIVGLGKTLFD